MLDEANKDREQEQPGAPLVPAEVSQATDADNEVSPLPRSVFSGKHQEQRKETGCDDPRAQDGELQTGPVSVVGCDSPDSTPDEHGEGDSGLSLPGQIQNSVLADGTGTPQDEVSPQMEDPFTVIDQSEEDKQAMALVMVAHDEWVGRGDIRDRGESPDVPDLEPDSPELECDDYQPAASLDLIRRGGEIVVARVEWHGLRPTLSGVGESYLTPSMPSAVYRSIHLPNDVAEYQSVRQVFDAVYDALQSCSALSQQQCELLTFWSIATWFGDSLDLIPRLTITGPRYAADLLFTLLNYVCHKAIRIVGMSSALLKEINMEQLQPTLLIYQAKASKTARELIDATDYPGYIFAGAGGVRRFSCAKVVYIGETYDLKQSASGLYIHLSRNAPVPARPYLSSKAIERLQNKLFSYRSFNLGRTEFLEVTAGELQPEFDLMARRLGAVIINDFVLQNRLVEILKNCSEAQRAERAIGIEGPPLMAALNLAHGNESRAYIQQVAVAANQIRLEQGEPSKLSNEKVGHLLRKLGLRTHRDMKGRALVFDQSTQLLLHQLCSEHDLLPAAPECGYCHKMQIDESE